MPHSQTFDALVLKTYDVGEADRYCIFFTREKGRIGARASGARRPKSRLGGALMPFRQVTVELKESGASWVICGVAHHENEESIRTLSQFTQLEEGIELLMRLVPHEGELPEIFDATRAFFSACARGESQAVMGYTFSLLHLLGLLPGEAEMEEVNALAPEEYAYINLCRHGRIGAPEPGCDLGRLSTVRSFLLNSQLQAPLKAERVAEAMR